MFYKKKKVLTYKFDKVLHCNGTCIVLVHVSIIWEFSQSTIILCQRDNTHGRRGRIKSHNKEITFDYWIMIWEVFSYCNNSTKLVEGIIIRLLLI